jgi:hypothetical protein
MTQLANDILFPIDEDNKKEAIKRAFTMPSLYNQLVNDFTGTKIPELISLANRLLNDYGIEVGAKDVAARNFIRSAEYAGVIQNGILVAENNLSTTAEQELIDNNTENNKNVNRDQISKIQPKSNDMIFEFSEGIKLFIPLNEKTSEAIMDGELKEVRRLLTEFAEKFMIKTEITKEE